MKNWIKQNKINIIMMVAYSIVSFVIVLFHEQWRDEAQQWLIVRDLDFWGIIQQMKYEGHFLLWYFIIMPFAKLGFPYITVNIISWLIVSISVWLIIKKAPFKWYVKLLIIFSIPYIYLYTAISRSYCLIPLAVVLIAITYKNRKNKPIQYVLSISLLANTHVIMLALVGLLLLEFYIEQIVNRKQNTKKENRKILISFLIVSIILILSILPILTSLECNSRVKKDISENKLNEIVQMIKKLIYGNFYIKNVLIWSGIMIWLFGLSIFEIKYYTKNFIIAISSILYQIFIYAFIYSGITEQRASTIFLIILLFAWIQKDDCRQENINKKQYGYLNKLTIIMLIISNISGFANFIIKEIKYDYSSAKEVAQFISKEMENKKVVIVSNYIQYTAAIVPYIKDLKIWNPQKSEYNTFVTWDADINKTLSNDFIDELKEKFNSNEKLYYICPKYDEQNKKDKDLIKKLQESNKLVEIFKTKQSISYEDYIIYEIKL